MGLPHIPDCHSGLPGHLCLHLPPDIVVYPQCKVAVPSPIPICRPGLPHTPQTDHICNHGLPDSPRTCTSGLPMTCPAGPTMCAGGPSFIIREIDEEYPYNVAVVDLDRLPKDMVKSLTAMIKQMQKEEKE